MINKRIQITNQIKEYFFKMYVLVEKGLGQSLFIEENISKIEKSEVK